MAFPSHLHQIGLDGGAVGDARGVVERGAGDGVERLASEKALVRGDDHVGKGEQAGGDRGAENIRLSVFEHVVVLLLVHVQAYPEKAMIADPRNQVAIVCILLVTNLLCSV